MPRSPLDDLQLPALVGTNRGMAKRLLAGTLRPPEKEALARVEEILKLEAEGLKFPAIAELIGWPVEKLRKWVGSNTYQILQKYVADRALCEDDQAVHDRRRQERRRWDSNGAKALDYYDQAFRRHTSDDPEKKRWKQGDFVDLDRAERAAQLFARSAGWTEPIPGHAKPKELKVGVIQGQMQAIAAADRRETVVRVTTTADGGTSIEVGSRETATMGGEG
jgi:hypothetical protein